MQHAEQLATSSCPILTRALGDSIGSEVAPTTAKLFATAEYTPYVNYDHHTRSGTFVAQQPFFTAATEYVKSTMPQQVMADLEALVSSQSAAMRS
jgi:hypothetical protein